MFTFQLHISWINLLIRINKFSIIIYTKRIINEARATMELCSCHIIRFQKIFHEASLKLVKIQVCPKGSWIYSHRNTDSLDENTSANGKVTFTNQVFNC